MSGAIQIFKKNPTAGEITSSLTNASDSAGLHFNGGVTASYVSAGDTTVIDGATNVSLEVIAATSATTEGDIFTKCRDATAFRLYFKDDGKVHFRLNNGTTNGDATSASSYNDGNPKHIVATWDALKLRIYINGNLDGEGDLAVGTGVKNVDDYLVIGAQVNEAQSASFFDGIVYRARLFNYVIDPTQFYENATVPFADQYGSQTTINSGTTTSGLRYRITARDGVDFTTIGAADNNVGTAFVATGEVTLDANDTVIRIGCVVDYDLAFANPPTQSLMVQDRAGAADGTAFGGVTQITKIEQLNAKAACIGTPVSAATPADGALLVSGDVFSMNGNAVFATQAGETTGEDYSSSLQGFLAGSTPNRLQLGNNGTNEIVAGSAEVGGALSLIVNNTAAQGAAHNGTVALSISSAGAVTMPSTPAFSVTPDGNQNNLAVDPTVVDIVFATEIFDQGANFGSNQFTAPIAGRYQFNATVAMTYLDSAADFYQINLVTSNRTYSYTIDPDFGQDATYWEIGNSFLVDMDASDTAKLQFFQSGGTQQTDIVATRTFFTGFLAC